MFLKIKVFIKLYRCGNLENFKKELPKFQEFLNDPKKFKEIYIFTFHFAKEKSKKGISFSYAQFFWNIFFSQKYEIQSKWDEFLNVKKIKILFFFII